MRLSDWGAAAPISEAAGPKVLAATEAVLATLGATPDSDCWVPLPARVASPPAVAAEA